jgi:hypothetical protein
LTILNDQGKLKTQLAHAVVNQTNVTKVGQTAPLEGPTDQDQLHMNRH